MNLLEITYYGIRNLQIRQLRSSLTIIGIVLGIATIFTLMSIGEGVRIEIDKQMSAFGSNEIFVVPISGQSMESFSGAAFSTNGKLYERDVDYVKRVPAVEEVSKVVYGRASLKFRDKEISAAIFPADASIFDQFGSYIQLEEGRFYTDEEDHVVVLANDAANKLFDNERVQVNNVIYINGEPYRVVGILKKIGTSLSQQDDSAIYMPYKSGRAILQDFLAPGEVFALYIKLREGYNPDDAAPQIEGQLAAAHRVSLDKKDFMVITPSFIQATVGSVLGVLNLFLLAIALISAFVGGIGISNTMFMSVMERRREIGVLKAIGAERGTIVLIFVVESALIGAGGGLVGLVLGYLALLAAGAFGVPYALGIYQIAFAFSFAVVVGVVSGLIPALNASKVPAVEALRYE